MKGITGINPHGMSVQDWTDQMALNVAYLGPLPQLLRERDWQDWGAALLSTAALGGAIIPSPYVYRTWQEWARQTAYALENVDQP